MVAPVVKKNEVAAKLLVGYSRPSTSLHNSQIVYDLLIFPSLKVNDKNK